MAIELKAPHYPESVEEGTLVKWHKAEGDAVKREEKIADIETDKVVLEVVAPDDGVLTDVRKKEGDTVQGEEVLATLDTEASVAAPAAAPPTEKAPEPPPEPEPPEPEPPEPEPPEPPAAAAKTPPPPAPAPAVQAAADGRPEERVPMSRLRARIAERLLQAQQTAAILTTFNEVNMQPVMDLRRRHKERFEKEHGVRLGFMSFFVKASVEALKQFPAVNASVDGRDIVYHGYYDLGVAVSSPRGLVVPVLRNADQMTFAEIEARVENLAQRARDGQLAFEELAGGTFTLTNGGVFGSLLSTPIVNPPQSAILGMHRIQDRPVAEDGQVVIRPVMYLALSYDHRLIDGREAVLFLVAIKDILEDPARMLLGI